MANNSELIVKIIFKDYYNSLETDDERMAIRDFFVPKYLSYSTFYNKVRDNNFTEYDFEKLQELTRIDFRP